MKDKLDALSALGVVILPNYEEAIQLCALLDEHAIRYRKSYYAGHRDAPSTYYVRLDHKDIDGLKRLDLLRATYVPVRGPDAGVPRAAVEVPAGTGRTGDREKDLAADTNAQQLRMAVEASGLAGLCIGSLIALGLVLIFGLDHLSARVAVITTPLICWCAGIMIGAIRTRDRRHV